MYRAIKEKHHMSPITGDEQQIETCLHIATEELGELIQAISKARRGKLDKDNMAEEIADVLIIMDWIKCIYGIDKNEIESWLNYKATRVKKRVEDNEFK